MIKLGEKKSFHILPEGVTVLKVAEVEYDSDFGKMTIKLVNKAGINHTERFSLISGTGEVNEKALNAFSYFARTVLNNEDLMEIDEQELTNKYIKCTVKHEKREGVGQYTGKTYINARLSEYEPASSFDTDTTAPTGKVAIDF